MVEHAKINSDLEFLGEANGLLDQIGKDMLGYEAKSLNDPARADLINNAFRNCHALSGLARLFGKTKMGELAKAMETVLDNLRFDRIKASQEAFDVLHQAREELVDMVNSGSEDAQVIELLLNELKSFIASQDAQAQASDNSISEELRDGLTEFEEHRLQENIKAGKQFVRVCAQYDLLKFDKALPDLIAWLKDQGELITVLPCGKKAPKDKILFDLWVAMEKVPDSLASDLEKHSATFEIVTFG